MARETGAGQGTRRRQPLAGIAGPVVSGEAPRADRQRRAVSRAGELSFSKQGSLIGFHLAELQSALWWVFEPAPAGFLRAMLRPWCLQLGV